MGRKKENKTIKLISKNAEIEKDIKDTKDEIRSLEFKLRLCKDYLRRQLAKKKALKKELLNNHGFNV